jgi:hypothetical protein
MGEGRWGIVSWWQGILVVVKVGVVAAGLLLSQDGGAS